MPRTLKLLAVLLALTLVAAACGDDDADDASAADSTAEPADTAEPDDAAATEPDDDTAEPDDAAATEPDDDMAEPGGETRVGIVPGGPHPYFAPWENAASAVVSELGITEAEYTFPDEWQVDLQNQLLESLVVRGFNSFVIFPGDDAVTNATIGDLASRGISSVVAGGCVTDPSEVVMCLATDVYASAFMATETVIAEMGGSGNIVHMAGILTDPNTQLRLQAVKDAAAAAEGEVVLLQELGGTDDSAEVALEAASNLLASSAADIDGIVATGFNSTVGAVRALDELGDGRIKFVGIDDDPAVLDAIRSGLIIGTMAQNPYGQAFLGAHVLHQLNQGCSIAAGAPFVDHHQTSVFVDSGTLLIDAGNVDSYQDDLVALTADLTESLNDDFLSC